jgi:hypothetical protein
MTLFPCITWVGLRERERERTRRSSFIRLLSPLPAWGHRDKKQLKRFGETKGRAIPQCTAGPCVVLSFLPFLGLVMAEGQGAAKERSETHRNDNAAALEWSGSLRRACKPDQMPLLFQESAPLSTRSACFVYFCPADNALDFKAPSVAKRIGIQYKSLTAWASTPHHLRTCARFRPFFWNY